MTKDTMELRVRYQETDQMGVVYYANYLIWFEVARTEFFRKRGVEYKKLEKEDNLFLPVIEAYCRYKRPLRYDDLVTITTAITDISTTSITFEYEVKRGEEVTATGKTKHVFINEKGKPVPIPTKVKEAVKTSY